MKKTFFFVISMVMVMSSCGSKESKTTDSAENVEAVEVSEGTLTSDASNTSQPYAEYVDFGSGELKVEGGHMLEIELNPQIKKGTGMSYNNDETEMILLDQSGKKIYTLHPFGFNSSFEKALEEGDSSYSDGFTFIGSLSTDEEAEEIVKNAKSFKIVMPLQGKKEEAANKADDNWNPVGTYTMEDADGTEFKLIVKKGGSAELINYASYSDHKPMKGSWTKGNGCIELNFFSGPFMHIASHEAITTPVLTNEYLYYDMDAFKNDSDCIEVRKVE